MPALVGYILLFVLVGVGFIFIHLVMGKFLRPARPDAEKLTIYECGEPTIGSAWVQFDLRFYVVALLFVIFDVEVAFFFPWAVVFGKTNALANPRTATEERAISFAELSRDQPADAMYRFAAAQMGAGVSAADIERQLAQKGLSAEAAATVVRGLTQSQEASVQQAANRFGWIAFYDILVFFGVLLVGFAYLWVRGDLEWVRSTAAERQAALAVEPPPGPQTTDDLVTAGTAAVSH